MAIFFECDYCGEGIYDGQAWVKLRSEEVGSHARARELDRMGLADVEKRIRSNFHFHASCLSQALDLIDGHRRWAKGDETGEGLEWELVERNWRRHRRTPPVLEPRYENRIMDLCRERGIDRDDLAAQLGTSRGAVGRWLKCYAEKDGHVVGLGAQWLKRLQMFFDLDSRDDLFKREPTGDAPAEEFVRAY